MLIFSGRGEVGCCAIVFVLKHVCSAHHACEDVQVIVQGSWEFIFLNIFEHQENPKVQVLLPKLPCTIGTFCFWFCF